jgi:hypothetical protein
MKQQLGRKKRRRAQRIDDAVPGDRSAANARLQSLDLRKAPPDLLADAVRAVRARQSRVSAPNDRQTLIGGVRCVH